MRELTLLFGATFKNVRECNSNKLTFCAVGFRVNAVLNRLKTEASVRIRSPN